LCSAVVEKAVGTSIAAVEMADERNLEGFPELSRIVHAFTSLLLTGGGV
jgi:hypothetical protein